MSLRLSLAGGSQGPFEWSSRAISHSDGLSQRRLSPPPRLLTALTPLPRVTRRALCVLSWAIPIHHSDARPRPCPPSCVVFVDRRCGGDRSTSAPSSVTSSDHMTLRRRRRVDRFTSGSLRCRFTDLERDN